jgi:ATP-dependent DNA helicase RecQ
MPEDLVRQRLEQTAREEFGWPGLRPGQPEAMAAVMGGRDTLAVMPTGFGKSAIYQVPALLLDGPTVIVSPLISLQHDQVDSLRHGDVALAGARELNSTIHARERDEIYRDLEAGRVEFLFLAPEQLAKDEVLDRVAAARPSLFVVDEAHLVASWGHDFRPDYLRLGTAIDRLGHPIVLALTATAARPVREEIVERLHLRDPYVVVTGFDRPNLFLDAVQHAEADTRREAILDRVADEACPGIVYATTRRETEEYAEALAKRGVRSAAYHAGLPDADRTAVHEAFLAGEVDVVVATTAFGMGIDKHDVRFVIHTGIADSLDSYYQEIGRAGRDGEPAKAVLFHGPSDFGLRRFLSASAPEEDDLTRVYDMVRAAASPVLRQEIAKQTGLSRNEVSRCCSLLEQANALRFDSRNRVRPTSSITTGEAVAEAIALAETRRRVEQSRLEMMREYGETLGCRRQFLLAYFGQDLPHPCGHCDTCASGTAYQQDYDSSDSPFPLDSRVTHPKFGKGVILRFEGDRIIVRFDEVGYRTLSLQAVRDHCLLEPVA